MSLLDAETVICPYCGESIEILIDRSLSHQVYIEDCSVCCRPIHVDLMIEDNGALLLFIKHENE